MFGAAAALAAASAALLWPRHPRLAVLPWVLLVPAFLLLFAQAPGVPQVFLGLGVCFFPFRALDAAFQVQARGRLDYLRWMTDFTRIPARDERPAPPAAAIRRRALRALTCLALGVGLLVTGFQLEPWRTSRYLDDLFLVAEAALLFTALADLIATALWSSGEPQPDLHDGSFLRATSLRAFWTRWNGPVSGVLARGVFAPITARGRRRLGLGVFAAFLASGTFHALPFLVAPLAPRLRLALAGVGLLFFALHGAIVLLEGTRLRRWLGPRGGRALVWLTFAATAPLYPSAMGVAVGFHGRPPEALTLAPLLPS